MCGIVGIHGAQDPAWIHAMNANIAHRGPDDSGIYESPDDGLSLAMRRLAIIDMDGGRQPMTMEGGRYTIIFNGEIFNAPELRRDLEARGVEFSSDHSDTEILLRSYALDGEDMLRRLNGMFAFAIFDNLEKTLFCARDRFGIKPFYYFAGGRRFAFASELKSLTALPFVERTLNPESLYHYASLMYVPGPATILASVHKLPPAHSLRYDLKTGNLRIQRWWRLHFGNERLKAEDANARVRSALTKAVERWTLSDVPIACSLSGGLDSSAIAVLLAESGRPLKTYSVGFTGPGEDSWNELPLARELAQKLGAEHNEIVIDPESLIADLPKMAWHLDEPYGGGLPSWAVFKFMSEEVKVGLTGTGGDEIFGDYMRWRHYEGRTLPAVRTKARFAREYFERHYYLSDAEKCQSVFQPHMIPENNTSDFLYSMMNDAPPASVRDRITRMDMETQLSEEFLLMTDRLSMAHSLEVRTPFLDHEFVESMFSMAAVVRTRFRPYKQLLREAMAPLLSKTILDAPKKGFVMPLKLWLRGPLSEMTQDLLAPQRLSEQGFYRADFHDRYVTPHLKGQADNTNLIWGALMFQLWYRGLQERPQCT
ncbi:MAG: asparagine synthase (glutamine-hydrolyzing) [Rhodospirillaceae bacterium]|nr:asparagine synthase (glutamine-hydrolyzing) [Rhodospirillaceae bacterium]